VALKEAINQHSPFVNNKYTKWYMEIVSKECNDDYVEKHHILPKCLFPEYDKCEWNLVKLSARKHFIAHMLLFRMFEKGTKSYGKMLSAAVRMKNHSSTDKRYLNSRLYEGVKLRVSQANRQRKWSEEHKQMISKKITGIIRGPMSEEAKKKMVASKKANHVPKIWMNKNGIQTKVVYEKINDYLLDGWTKGTSKKHLTEEYSQKMRDGALLQWKKLKETGYTSNLNRK
jgi:hypothetical protein